MRVGDDVQVETLIVITGRRVWHRAKATIIEEDEDTYTVMWCGTIHKDYKGHFRSYEEHIKVAR